MLILHMMQLKMGHFCVGMFFYNFIGDKYSSMFKDVVLGSLKSFFRWTSS